MEEDR
jgi:serine/threonine protein kinase